MNFTVLNDTFAKQKCIYKQKQDSRVTKCHFSRSFYSAVLPVKIRTL